MAQYIDLVFCIQHGTYWLQLLQTVAEHDFLKTTIEIKWYSSDNPDLVRCRISTLEPVPWGHGTQAVELEARVVELRCYWQMGDSAYVHRKNIPVL